MHASTEGEGTGKQGGGGLGVSRQSRQSRQSTKVGCSAPPPVSRVGKSAKMGRLVRRGPAF